MKTRVLWLFATALLPWCSYGDTPVTSVAPTTKLTVTTGFDYSTGDYGESSSTDIFSIPVITRYDIDQWTLKLTVPYLWVSGPGNVITGLGRVGAAGSASNQTRSGWGDVVTAATYNVYDNRSAGWAVDLTGKVKFGTADRSRGLGTGESDFMMQADVYKSMGSLTPFGSFGYRILGSPPGISLNNVFFSSVGIDSKVNEDTSVGASFLVQEKISTSIDSAKELSAYVSHHLGPNWRVQGYVLTGFTNASPKFEIGGQVGYAF